MKAYIRIFIILLVGICTICFSANVTSADDVCFFIPVAPGMVGGTMEILKLGYIIYGNNHITLSGTDTSYLQYPGPVVSVSLVNGNAEIVNGKIEAILLSLNKLSYHLVLDPTTLNGTFTSYFTNGILYQNGSVNIISCSGQS